MAEEASKPQTFELRIKVRAVELGNLERLAEALGTNRTTVLALALDLLDALERETADGGRIIVKHRTHQVVYKIPRKGETDG